jgi:site-specific DNA recombinase
MRRAALYARVSSSHQEKEETIESQLEQLRSFAAQRQYELPPEHEFIDQAVSGEHLARPALERLRDAAVAGRFRVLLCQHVDRLARNLGAQYVLLAELEAAGVEVVFLNQPDLGKDPQAKLLVNIQGAFAEYERVHMQERLRRGRLYRLRHGQLLPSQAPYGYRFRSAHSGQPCAWVIVPAEAAVVQSIFAWYNGGAVSLGQIARQLNAQGTPSPRGGAWATNALSRMLRQAAYKGTAYYGRYQQDYASLGQRRRHGRGVMHVPRKILRPAEEWIEISVPPLVDESTWQAAQERLALNARFARRNSHRPYLLRGLLVCGICQRTLRGRMQHDVLYYTCHAGGQHHSPAVPRHRLTLRADVVEPAIWQALAELLGDPQRIQAAWEEMCRERCGTPTQTSHWQERQTRLRKQRQRLLDAYQVGLLSLEELISRHNPLDIELQELDKRLEASRIEQSCPPALEAFTQRMEHALHASDVETQQEVLRLLIERIVVTDDALTVYHIIPTVNESRLRSTCPG